jgi:hypothetical protein
VLSCLVLIWLHFLIWAKAWVPVRVSVGLGLHSQHTAMISPCAIVPHYTVTIYLELALEMGVLLFSSCHEGYDVAWPLRLAVPSQD